VDPDILASGAILISAWWASPEIRAGGATADGERLLNSVRSIRDFVAEFDQRSVVPEVHESFEALGRVRDDTHARAVLQRHLAADLAAEPAHLAELLRLLLVAGTVSSRDGITRIDLLRQDGGRLAREDSTVISVVIPHPDPASVPLTPPARLLLGRDGEMEKALRLAESDSAEVRRIAVSAAAAGVGTTEFARGVAGEMYRGKSSRLQLEVSFDQTRAPDDALFDALAALGVAVADVPATLGERAACYREALAREAERTGTTPLILLDDVARLSQVRPFLPACAATVLMTGDHLDSRLAGERMTVVDLGPLDEQQSLALLGPALASGHAAFATDPANKDAVRRIIRLCEGVPLALAVVAGVIESVAAAHDRPDTLDPLAAELRRARYGLESVSPDERAVFAALQVSYAHLPARQRRVLYTLALTGLLRFDLGLIAAAGGLPPGAARDTADELAGLALLEIIGPARDRWRMHRLVRRFILGMLPSQVTAGSAEILEAAARLYLRRAQSLAALLGVRAAQTDPVIAAWAREQLADQQPALTALLRAALSAGLASIARELAAGLAALMERGWEGPGTAESVGAIRAAARQGGDRGLEARAYRIFAQHAERRGASTQARAASARADELSGTVADPGSAPAGRDENRRPGTLDPDGTVTSENPPESATRPRQDHRAADRSAPSSPGEVRHPAWPGRDGGHPDQDDDDDLHDSGADDGRDEPDPNKPDIPRGGAGDGPNPSPPGGGGGRAPRPGGGNGTRGGPGGSGRGGAHLGGVAAAGAGGATVRPSSPVHDSIAAGRGRAAAPATETTFGSCR
jgi:hypothetical protein